MTWMDVMASTTTWTWTQATRGSGQFVPLAPVDLSGGDVDFCVKINDEAPLYVYDPAPLRVAPTQMESP